MAGKTVNELPYKHDEALEELMKSALRALRKAKRGRDTNKELKSLERACGQLDYLCEEMELQCG
jgi:hypothetical protein